MISVSTLLSQPHPRKQDHDVGKLTQTVNNACMMILPAISYKFYPVWFSQDMFTLKTFGPVGGTCNDLVNRTEPDDILTQLTGAIAVPVTSRLLPFPRDFLSCT